MKERAEAMVLASFVADSHALGAHSLHDQQVIAQRFGRIEELLPPPAESPFAAVARGGFTHDGAQSLALLRSLVRTGAFDPDAFAESWRELVGAHEAYRDYPLGWSDVRRGSDLAPVARVAAIAYRFRDDLEQLISTARAQCSATDGDGLAVDTAEYIARVVWHILNGKTPTASLQAAADTMSSAQISALVSAGIESTEDPTCATALRFGQDRSIEAALPFCVHIVCKHEGSLKEALVDNLAGGGQSAVRAAVIGMILGCFHGRDAIPDDWLEDLAAYQEISGLLEDLEARVHPRAAAADRPFRGMQRRR
ncbi:MAG: ADP-ribosylglycohydrolase family protein [Spirochaetaceae bacterium]|nr:MAG: ADP-ribosylglycohydrolase family protein [Spirochaetaceae bacterium]